MDHVSKGLVPVPEPSVILQLVAGGVGLVFLNKRRMGHRTAEIAVAKVTATAQRSANPASTEQH